MSKIIIPEQALKEVTAKEMYDTRIWTIDTFAAEEKRLANEWLKKMQEQCLHPRTTFHEDPAGDTSKSYHECLDCGQHI